MSGSTLGISGEASYGRSTSTTDSSGQEQSSLRRLSLEDEAFVQQMMRNFSAGTSADTAGARRQAISDVQGSVESLFKEFQDTALPQIFSAQKKTGGYAGTSAQLLANDAYSRTVARGAQLTLDAITNYENIALQRSGQALQGLGMSLESLLRAREDSSSTSKSTSKTKSETFGTSVSGGWGI